MVILIVIFSFIDIVNVNLKFIHILVCYWMSANCIFIDRWQ